MKRPPAPKIVTAPAQAKPPSPPAPPLRGSPDATTDGADTADGNAGERPAAGDGGEAVASHAGDPRGGGSSARPAYGLNPKPPYPVFARRMGEQGVVLLRVHVRADGSVAKVELKQSSGSELLDDSALRTVRDRWRFIPARMDGVPVENWVEVPIRFVLGDS
jgi:protein TonB